MKDETFARLARCPDLPSLPAVVLEVLDLCARPDFDLQNLATLIAHDPALATKLLETVNSPFFGTGRPVTTISHAVVCLGARSVRTVALGFALVASRRRPGGFDHKAFWRRALLSAVAARAIANSMGSQFWEEAFLGALLQDIGMLALSATLGAEYDEIVAASSGCHQTQTMHERAVLGTDHAEVGMWLVERWRLPPVLQLGVRYSHARALEDIAEEQQLAQHAAMIAASGAIADVWLGTDTSAAAEAVRGRAHALLGLTAPSIEAILDEVAAAAPELSGLFEVVILPPQDMIEILGRAKQALTNLSLEHMQLVAQAEAVTQTLTARNSELEAEVNQDPLTSLGNRRHLEQILESEFAAASYLKRPLSLLFCDIDHFKSVNDTYGHHAGDQVLATVATAIADTIRKTDHCARFGGEEFVVLLPNSDYDDALDVAERIRIRIAEMAIAVEGNAALRLTISLGASTTSAAHPSASPEALMNSADAALYEAKRGGRNRVVSAHSPADEREAS